MMNSNILFKCDKSHEHSAEESFMGFAEKGAN